MLINCGIMSTKYTHIWSSVSLIFELYFDWNLFILYLLYYVPSSKNLRLNQQSKIAYKQSKIAYETVFTL